MIYKFEISDRPQTLIVEDSSLDHACVQVEDLWNDSMREAIDSGRYEAWESKAVEFWKPKGQEIHRALVMQYFEWRLDGNRTITISLL